VGTTGKKKRKKEIKKKEKKGKRRWVMNKDTGNIMYQ
jgi:hypothetical protein